MRAFQLVEWQQPPELRDVPVPEPGPGEVLVKVGGAGACHSDLHVMEWPRGLPALRAAVHARPRERRLDRGARRRASRAGRSARRSRSTGRGAAGAAARAGPGWRPCASARRELGAAGGGLGRDGGMAEYMLVPDPRLLVPLGDLDPRDAAPLSDAALTPYHAIKLALAPARPGHERRGHRRRRPRPHGRADPARADARARDRHRHRRRPSSSSPVDVGADHTVGVRRGRRGRDPRAHRRARRRARARLRGQRLHARARRPGRRQGRGRDGHRRRRRHAGIPLQHAAVRREPDPPVLGQHRSNSPRCSSWRARVSITRARRALPARARHRRLRADARTARSPGAPSSRRTADPSARLGVGRSVGGAGRRRAPQRRRSSSPNRRRRTRGRRRCSRPRPRGSAARTPADTPAAPGSRPPRGRARRDIARRVGTFRHPERVAEIARSETKRTSRAPRQWLRVHQRGHALDRHDADHVCVGGVERSRPQPEAARAVVRRDAAVTVAASRGSGTCCACSLRVELIHATAAARSRPCTPGAFPPATADRTPAPAARPTRRRTAEGSRGARSRRR